MSDATDKGSEQPTPYELEPTEPPAVVPAAAIPPKAEKKQRPLSDAGLLDDFDEDADFDKDPEVERVIKGPKAAKEEAAKPPEAIFVKPGLGEPQSIALVAAGVLLGAAIAASVRADGRWYAAAISTVYEALIHTLTGVGAIAVAAHLTEKRIGSLPLAGARMLLAVSVFSLIFYLNIPIPGRTDEVLIACGAYIAVVWGLFRLPAEPVFYVGAVHAGLWLVVWLGGVLQAWASVPVPKPA
ncbi:MAG: hypothetical protein JSR77_15525 [Planctomycetes bacterium]|nr:hypothetical protein [Planctomycetota bacterium]